MERVFLIGIPHFNWKLIKLLIKKGDFKNLKLFLKKSSYGKIIPQQDHCSSPVEFTSMVTGVKKEKHGIGYGKGSDEEYVKDGRMITRLDIKAKPLWDIVQEYGKRVGIYHWLLTWPPKKIKGFMVTDRLSQDEKNKTYPKWLSKLLSEEELKYDIFNPEIAANLIEKFDVDLFLGMDEWAHGPTHILWEYIEPVKGEKRKSKEEIKKGREELINYYKWLEVFLGIVEDRFKDANVIIAGDSGMRPADYPPTYCTGREVIDLFKKLDIGIQLYAYDVYPPRLPKSHPTLYIPGKTLQQKKKIVEVLSRIKLKKTGDSFIKNIKWNGDYLSFVFNFHPWLTDYKSGDIFLILPDGTEFKLWITKSTGVSFPKGGAFIAKGPSIRENFYVGKVNTVDIAPTILHLLDIPSPKYMDGRVLKITKNKAKR
jgi:hypothetical protein